MTTANSIKNITIYHNPKCSKSREALELLRNQSMEINVIDYLKNPLDLAQLTQLRAYFSLADFVRTNEPIFKQLGLSLNEEQSLLKAMVQEPILMQRPIVVYKRKALIARPPEKVLALIKEAG